MNEQDMSRALLEQHFDIAFAAPDGIKKLRELILTLAMQGKLVPQDPNDQPASELLKEIEAEKRRMVKAGKIREPKPLPEIKPDEVPYELPKSWEWVRFANIAQHNSGKMLDKSRNKGKYRDYITTSNLYWGFFELDNVRQMPISDEEIEKCTARKGDLLLCEGGEAGRAAVWFYDNEVCFQNHIHRARFYCDIDPYYAYRFFEKLNATGEINQYRQGVGISNMSGKVLASIVLPFPPLAEQKRIVARIDQLMTRCDELEKLRSDREAKRLTVHISALNRLFEAQGSDSFTDAWQFLNRHFGELYSVKANVTELRKAMLQLGVMGKLVPQDPNDQPASELLKEIEAEKRRLVKEGKIKPQKPLPEIKPGDVPCELPVGWKWVRLGQVTDYNGRKNIASEEIADDTWLLDLEDIEKDTSRIIYRAKYSERLSTSTKSTFQKGDVLYGKLRPYLNKVVVADTDGVCTTEIIPIVPSNVIDSQFLRWLLKRPAFLTHVDSLMYGVKMPRLGTDDAVKSIHPLPPLTEQYRIVVKIDKLMALCDQLEQQIDATAGKQSALLNAIMAQM